MRDSLKACGSRLPPLNASAPRYTQDARDNKVQGAVDAALLIDETGKVTKIVRLTTLGHGLDEEAARAAAQLKFSPAIIHGKPAPFWQEVVIEFQLR